MQFAKDLIKIPYKILYSFRNIIQFISRKNEILRQIFESETISKFKKEYSKYVETNEGTFS